MILESIAAILLTIGLFMLILEALIPGVQFIVAGITMLVTGAISLTFGITNPIILGVLLILIGGLTIFGYKKAGLYDDGTSSKYEKTKGASSLKYTKGYSLTEITPNSGKVKLNGNVGSMSSTFQARTPTGKIQKDTEIIVINGGGGNIVEVRPTEDKQIDEMYDINQNVEKEMN